MIEREERAEIAGDAGPETGKEAESEKLVLGSLVPFCAAVHCMLLSRRAGEVRSFVLAICIIYISQKKSRAFVKINEINKKDEFMGWASLSPKKYSIYRLFTSGLFSRHKEVDLDAKLNGGERAIVLSGEYDNMLPMDIYGEFLIKSIIAFDIDKMEQLGIYEVAPEDFALAEYADTSKLELQRIVREGLDKMRAEMS